MEEKELAEFIAINNHVFIWTGLPDFLIYSREGWAKNPKYDDCDIKIEDAVGEYIPYGRMGIVSFNRQKTMKKLKALLFKKTKKTEQ